MTNEQIFEVCSNTVIWTIIGAVLGAILGVLFTNIYTKRANRQQIKVWKWEKCLKDGYTVDTDIMISLINKGKVALPLLDIHLMDSAGVNVKLVREKDVRNELKPDQILNFHLNVLKSEKTLTNEAKAILRGNFNQVCLAVFHEKSNKNAIYTNNSIAQEIYQSISNLVGNNFKKPTLLDGLSFEQRKLLKKELEEMEK